MGKLIKIFTAFFIVSVAVGSDPISLGPPLTSDDGSTEQVFKMRDGSLYITFTVPKNGVLGVMSMTFSQRSDEDDRCPDKFDFYTLNDGVVLIFYRFVKGENRRIPVAVYTPNEERNGLVNNEAWLAMARKNMLKFSVGVPAKPGELFSVDIDK